MKTLVIFLCAGIVMSMAYANPDELAELQKILQASRASWQAGETSFSQLSVAEQEQMMGVLDGIGGTLPPQTIIENPVRDERFEVPYTAIRNQGQCGSCYSFGACASYESNRMMTASQTFDLSEQWFMMKAKEIGPYGGCSGWYLDTSMNLLKDHGVADESDCAYLAKEQACPSGTTAKHSISEWACTTDKDTIKSALQTYGAVYVGFAVYSDFSYYTSGYYKYTSGYKRGYHAVAIIGYDDTGFRVKNSWGTGWGNKGFFQIEYSQMTNQVEFGTCFGGSYYIVR